MWGAVGPDGRFSSMTVGSAVPAVPALPGVHALSCHVRPCLTIICRRLYSQVDPSLDFSALYKQFYKG